MKNICRKLLAVALSAVMLCLSSTQMVFADTIEMKNNRIDFIERDVTDTAAYLKYYMTINEKPHCYRICNKSRMVYNS